MVVRVVLGTGIALAVMAMIANGTVLRRVGLTSSCTGLQATVAGAALESCRAGWLDGYPNLSSHGCTSVNYSGSRNELWSCPVTR